MQIQKVDVRPCEWCKGDKRNFNMLCFGCGGWAILWWANGWQRYGMCQYHRPSAEEVVKELWDFVKAVRDESERPTDAVA